MAADRLEYKYYRSNLGRMKYDEYRGNGWFIGSGVIESGFQMIMAMLQVNSSPSRLGRGGAAPLPQDA